ncbi:MAG: response regulator [Candidatus Obscuribacter sp.]|nr:response regulator [Candidatus Obscuribacter sp.]MBK9206299.1 response regulator [Candidatus Obscuribacter sp.]MBK9618203.1 response regulator [Candidatus Obscuribacter sp.]MBK9771055.1 response regulator [Candidatus Obscuribacter sp.]MDQ5967248.1 Response regulator [Cyanobacteriota bacterium erpe_2018_sw_39hr_WHONDRS-SW48-000098_B_bin.30]
MKVLIADQDANGVRLLDMVLKEEGFETIICQKGEEAFRRWQSNDFPPFIIMDPNLPDMPGIDLLKKLRNHERGKTTYVMFLTARGLRENIIQAFNQGVDEYMVKPFYAEELKARLKAGKRTILLQKQIQDRNILLEELVYAVTHDMRTPLIAMEMTMDQAQDNVYGELPADYKKILGTTKRSLQDLLSMVDNLLRVARYESGKIEHKKELTPLVTICQECIAELKPLWHRKNIACKLNTNVAQVELTIVRQDLKRVIFNLLDNAIKFTPSGGSIDLSVELIQGRVIVGVRDSGRGIAPEETKMVFDRFARAQGARHAPGTGLGLYMCRKVIEAHGGIVDCISRAGQGTTFSFMLPVANKSS